MTTRGLQSLAAVSGEDAQDSQGAFAATQELMEEVMSFRPGRTQQQGLELENVVLAQDVEPGQNGFDRIGFVALRGESKPSA